MGVSWKRSCHANHINNEEKYLTESQAQTRPASLPCPEGLVEWYLFYLQFILIISNLSLLFAEGLFI